MKPIHNLCLILSILFLQSCYSSEGNTEIQVARNQSQHTTNTDTTTTKPDLVPIIIVEADDEVGYIYGYTNDTVNAQITTYRVVAPYSTITFDSINGHRIDCKLLTKALNDSNDTLTEFTAASYQLLAF